jgi:hypothetical protein
MVPELPLRPSAESKRLSCVTPWRPATRGVPQGPCLSPLLFNIFVHELPSFSGSDCVQFADDITSSAEESNPHDLVTKLGDVFNRIKLFCNEHELIINTGKTQLIVFISIGRRLPDDFELPLDSTVIKPVATAKLLGVALDHHFTMAPHIENINNKCHGLLGILRRAYPYLPQELLKLAYVALIHSHMEYASSLLEPVAESHLNKFDVIQKIASRKITGSSSQAHSTPLLAALGLESLPSRREKHVLKLIDSIIQGNSHLAFSDFFSIAESGTLTSEVTTRIGLGKKRFRYFGPALFNSLVTTDCECDACSTPQ